MFDPKIIHKRKRKAGLRIYDNSALRDNLDDDQAKPLLTWAAAQAEKGAERTKHLGDEDAQAIIDHQVKTVSHVVRLINGLTKSFPEITNELEAEAVLQRLMESLVWLGENQDEITTVFNNLMAHLGSLDEKTTFDHLIQLINLAPNQTTATEKDTENETATNPEEN